MKKYLFILACCSMLFGAEVKKEEIHYGTILEMTAVMGYDYLKVDENGSERWVAIAKAPVKIGDRIGYDTKTVMHNFKSKSLGKTFKEIVFANEVYVASRVLSLKDQIMQNKKEIHTSVLASDFVEKPYYTVEELYHFRKNLAGKSILIKAKVTKVSRGIMKKDWVHLQDGTGSVKTQNEDIVFTCAKSTVNAGDTVTAKATIIVDKDFGYGYFYKVLGEEASFKKR